MFMGIATDPPNATLTPELIIINSTSIPSVSFTCEVFSIPLSTIVWTKGSTNTVLRQDGKITIQQSATGNLTTSVLTLSSPMDPDESNYTCSATNNVQNVLDTPEQATGTLYVQGSIIIIIWESYMLSYLAVKHDCRHSSVYSMPYPLPKVM